MYLVSKCLLGENCKYNGTNNKNEAVISFLKDKNYISVCPECLGGLTIPRNPSEISGEKVISSLGDDVTDMFKKGAEKTLEIAKINNVNIAILKQRSPSCGCGFIYDGTFSKTVKKGNGVTADLLLKNNIKILTEENFLNE